MNAVEKRAKLTRLRDQVADLQDSIQALYAGSDAGSRFEARLEQAKDDARKLQVSLGSARDAVPADDAAYLTPR